MVDSVEAQRARVFGEHQLFSTGPSARLRFTPGRPLTGAVAFAAEHLRPDDVLLDVGGGAGRMALALAPRCREVVNVDPAEAMLQACRDAAAEAGIANVRTVASTWPADGLEGDLVLSFNVVFYVPDVVPFVRGLHRAARRRVVLGLRAVPMPNRYDGLFRLVYGEPIAHYPTYRELLPVLWDLDLLPDVAVVPEPAPAASTPEAAVEDALRGVWIHPRDRDRARPLLTAHFDELFVATPAGYEIRLGQDPRQVLVTWTTGD
jgi:SAM-dependent methyltransferase